MKEQEILRNKRILFLKNEPGKLLQTKDLVKKRTGNEAKTKLANLLIIKNVPKKRTGNEPENEATEVVENKGSAKNEPETNRGLDRAVSARRLDTAGAVEGAYSSARENGNRS